MHDVSHPEPFDLVRPSRRQRDTFESWFGRARMTIRSLGTWTSAPEVVVVRRPGEMQPAVAGAITGAVGAVIMLAVATVLARRGDRAIDVSMIIGDVASGGRLFGTAAFGLGLVIAIVVGAAIGAAFAWITRRLRHLAPLMTFGLLLASASWIVVHAIALPRLVPWLARALPIAPMTVAAAVFGVVLSLELPLRARRVG